MDQTSNIPALSGEIWREIAGYDEKYYVSNYGRVISYKKIRPHFLA